MAPGFHTLKRAVEVSGVGLHSGAAVRVRLVPCTELGLVFVRTDLAGAPRVAADVQNVTTTHHATTLQSEGATVSTTEHLLAALWAMDITHCQIEVHGPEIPILDGSALPWCRAILEAGSTVLPGHRPVWGLKEPVWVEEGGATVRGLPHPNFRLSVAVDFEVKHAGPQSVDLVVDAGTFYRELAPARTFTLEAWLEPLRGAGLIRGGSEDNAIVFFTAGPQPQFRFPEELARHKALDAIGDLALLFAPSGAAFRGHVVAVKAGHGSHRAWMRRCLDGNYISKT